MNIASEQQGSPLQPVTKTSYPIPEQLQSGFPQETFEQCLSLQLQTHTILHCKNKVISMSSNDRNRCF